MIYHIIDDEKFIDVVINDFKNLNIPSVFIIPTRDDSFNVDDIKYIKQKEFIKVVNLNRAEQTKIFNNKDVKCIIYHNLINQNRICVHKLLPLDIKKIGFLWGSEIYNILSSSLYLKKTTSFRLKLFNLNGKIRVLFPKLHSLIYKKIKPKHVNKKDWQIAILKELDGVSTIIPSEYDLLKPFLDINCKHVPYTYGNMKNLTQNIEEIYCKDDNILLGNSSALTNNHLDLIKLIKPTKKKIFVPLSYGQINSNKYIDEITRVGQKKFTNFMPLLEFLEYDDYKQLLTSCGNVIMGHLRQQAMGNLIVSASLGANIYLHKKNPAYRFLKELGVNVQQLENINKNNYKNNYKNNKKQNTCALNKFYSLEKHQERINHIIKFINE